MSATDVAREIGAHLASKGLPASQPWINGFMTGQRPSTPLPALKQTAMFRFLQSDITGSLQKSLSSVFPTDIANGETRERRIAGPITVQVLDIEDIGRSRWSQVEALEAEERGEKTKGREIIRVVPGETDEDDAPQQQSTGPHKLILQDAQGICAYAMELLSIPGIDLSMSIGAKLVLKDFTVARGCILLEPNRVSLLGGKIEDLHKRWKEGRKTALQAAARGNSDAND